MSMISIIWRVWALYCGLSSDKLGRSHSNILEQRSESFSFLFLSCSTEQYTRTALMLRHSHILHYFIFPRLEQCQRMKVIPLAALLYPLGKFHQSNPTEKMSTSKVHFTSRYSSTRMQSASQLLLPKPISNQALPLPAKLRSSRPLKCK